MHQKRLRPSLAVRRLTLVGLVIAFGLVGAGGAAGMRDLSAGDLSSETLTRIHDSAHQVVTTVPVGTTVHDFVLVIGALSGPVPTGNVNIDWFLNGDCEGAPAANSGSIGPLDATGQFDATGFAFTVLSAGQRAFKAHYEGDGTYAPSDGPCESLTVEGGLASDVTTEIHDPAHQTVTTVEVGTTVHDFVTVTGQSGNPTPTGNVHLEWFDDANCLGNVIATSGSIGPLDASGQFDATGFAFTVLTAGHRSFKAHYEGDGTYAPSDGPCEPLTIVDANIQIAPNGVDRVNDSHTFTAHVNVNDGNGFVNAPDGTQISFTVDSGPGGFTSANPCTTSGGTGSCQVTLTSAVTGVTTVSAHTTLSVGGLVINRDTNGVGANSPPATKLWVDAAIVIAPNATNEVGQPHTFTATLLFDTGSGLQPAGSGQFVTVTLTPANGACPIPAGPFNLSTNAAGQVSVTFTSPCAGTVAGHAAWTGSVAGSAPFTVQTDGIAPNSGDAVKTFVDAAISIAPDATNEVGQEHTFTVTLRKDEGDGLGFQPFAGAHVDFTLTNLNGASFSLKAAASTCDDPGPNTDGAGQCVIVINSSKPGKVRAGASWTGSVAGSGTFTVLTNGIAPNSGDAVKTYVDAFIAITPPTATNPVNTPHAFAATVFVNDGSAPGYVQAPNGTAISFTIDSGPGAFTTPNPCITSGGTGTCQITMTSSVPGTSIVSAHTTVTIGGVSVTRDTDGVFPNSAPATKQWVASALPSETTTQIHNEAHAVVMTVPVGTTVHDFVRVSGGGPVPTGNVNIDWFLNGDCEGAPAANSGSIGPLDATGQFDATGFAFTVLSAGQRAFKAHYEGDGTYAPSDSPCEPLTIVDAAIVIAPNATNEVGQPHTFTATLLLDTGTGVFVPAGAGEPMTITLNGSNGANPIPAGPFNLSTNGAGQVSVTFTSPTPGQVRGHASSTLSVAGSAPFTVQTDGIAPNSGDAVKTFVDAYIEIAPPLASNPINTTHTYIAGVFVDDGSGAGYVAAPNGTPVTFVLLPGSVGSFVAGNTCLTIAGSCTIDTTSAIAGLDAAQASATLSVGGVVLTRTTGQPAPGHANSPNAIKQWLSANADLAIRKSASPNPVLSGNQLTYTITVINNGPLNATGVTMTDPLPADVVFKSMSTTQGSCVRTTLKKNSPKDGLVTCDLGSLAPGKSAAVTIVVIATKPEGLLTNTACVSGNESDPIPGNNCATAVTTVVGS